MLTLAFNIQLVKSEPRTWTVDDDGVADFQTIQEAINVANEGDTIFVKSGTYYEHVVVNKTVFLLGENKETTLIDGNAIGTVVSVTTYNVVISRFTIQNSGEYPSSNIRIVNSDGNYITHNIVRNSNDRGIYLDRSMGNTISDNDILNNFYGILLDESTQNIISNNNVSSNTYGIYLYESSRNNIISDNIVSNSATAGIFLRGNGSHSPVTTTLFRVTLLPQVTRTEYGLDPNLLTTL